MTDQDLPWQRTFAAFAGPGIHHPSESMRVSDSDAQAILAGLAARPWLAASAADGHPGYAVRNAADIWCTALVHERGIVGFYADSVLWIAKAHRGRGLHVPLILAAAMHRGGGVLPPGVVFQGYTAAGIGAHRAAHRHAVAAARARGLPVPDAVLAEQADAEPVQ